MGPRGAAEPSCCHPTGLDLPDVSALEQCGALCLGLGTVASSRLAIIRSLLAICRGAHSTFSRLYAVSSGALAVLFSAQHDLLVRSVVPVGRDGGVVA
jgi:hypothetical protein